MNWENSRVLITGAASGIGASLAERLAASGAIVALVDRDADRLEEILKVCRGKSDGCSSWVGDLRDTGLAERIARETWKRLGHIDVLVNNAAKPSRGPITRMNYQLIEDVMRVNFLSPARMTLAVLPGMLQRGRGTIVNVSSIDGRIGVPMMSTEAASKFALCGWSESIALDLRNSGVHVNLVNPGPIDTEYWQDPMHRSEPYDGPMVPVEEAVDSILRAIWDEQFECYIPTDLENAVVYKTKELAQFMDGLATMLRPKDADPVNWGCAEEWDYDRRGKSTAQRS